MRNYNIIDILLEYIVNNIDVIKKSTDYSKLVTQYPLLITNKLIEMFLPTGMKEWARKCNKFIAENYDNL